MALSRDEILAADDRVVEVVDVPEWGGEVYVRSLTRAEVRPFTETGEDLAVGTLVSVAVCDEDGRPLFTEDDVPALEKKSLRALNRVVAKAMEINGLGGEQAEQVLGNSGSGQQND